MMIMAHALRYDVVGVFLLCLALVPAAQAAGDNYTVEVCPDAKWRDAIFLKGPSPQGTFDDVKNWKGADITSYAKTYIIPQIRANIAFFAMAIIGLVIFLLWRIIRRCCLCCCMRQSCEQKRASADPKIILGGCGFWALKITLFVFILGAALACIAGMGLADKKVFSKGWDSIDDFTDYMGQVADTLDNLVGNVSTINPTLDGIRKLARDDIAFAELKGNLRAISTYLDSAAANPNTLDSALTAVDGNANTLKQQLAALRTSVTATAATLNTFSTGVGYLSTATTDLAGYKVKLDALSTELTTLAAAANPAAYPSTTNLQTKMDDVAEPTWSPRVVAMIATIDLWKAFKTNASSPGTFSGLAARFQDLNTSVALLTRTAGPAASAALVTFLNGWTGVTGNFAQLINRVDSIQANVVVFPSSLTAPVDKLRDVQNSTGQLLNQTPRPATLATQLSSSSLSSSIQMDPGTGTLVTSLQNMQTAVNSTTDAALDGARTALVNFRDSLIALRTPKATTQTAITAYAAGGGNTNGNLATLQTAGAALKTKVDLASTAANTAATSVNVIALQTAVNAGPPTMSSRTSTITSALSAQSSALTSLSSSVDGLVPPMGPFVTSIGAFKTSYNGMPTPKSGQVTPVTDALTDLEDVMATTPGEIKDKIADVQSSFGDSVDTLRTDVVDKANDIKDDGVDLTDRIDKIRYTITVVLYAIAFILLLIMAVCVGINCPWGVAFCMFWLYIILILFFLVATIYALLLAAVQDVCYHMESTVVSVVGPGSKMQPLVDYYFFGDNTTSVRTVLKTADLVDIDDITSQVTGQVDSVIADITATYTPKPKLKTILDGFTSFADLIVDQINGLIDLAGVSMVRPLYQGIKSFLCCIVPEDTAQMWAVLTFGGWLILISLSVGCAFLGRLDKLPHSGYCGCKPMMGSRMKDQVHPSDPEKAIAVGQAPPSQAMHHDKMDHSSNEGAEAALAVGAGAAGGVAATIVVDQYGGAPAVYGADQDGYGAMSPGGVEAGMPPHFIAAESPNAEAYNDMAVHSMTNPVHSMTTAVEDDARVPHGVDAPVAPPPAHATFPGAAF